MVQESRPPEDREEPAMVDGVGAFLQKSWGYILAAGIVGGIVYPLVVNEIERRRDAREVALRTDPDACFAGAQAGRGKPEGGAFRVMVARLVGDAARRLTRRLESAVHTGLDIVSPAPAIEALDCPVMTPTGDLSARVRAGEERGAGWLEAMPGDVLVWGYRIDDDTLALRVTGRAHRAEERAYGFEDALEIDPALFEAMAPILAARIATMADPAYEEGVYLVDTLLPLRDTLTALAADPPMGFGWEERARVLNDLGTLNARLGEQRGLAEDLMAAIAAYRAALEEQTRDRVPLDWAATQNNLALTDLAFAREAQGDTSAVARYREAGLVRIDGALAVFREAEATQYEVQALQVRAALEAL